jgi:hypothetical protein
MAKVGGLDAWKRGWVLVVADSESNVSTSVERITFVGTDDILDAFAAAWSARLWRERSHVQLGGDNDSRDLRMENIA